jgi:hypothetical protein
MAVPDAENVPGELANHAASILMKVLYGARMGRWDLLKAVASLATHLTKWTPACDKALFRLMCYINCTASATLTGYIGDAPGDLSLRLYADADFTGDKTTHRSTSGALLALPCGAAVLIFKNAKWVLRSLIRVLIPCCVRPWTPATRARLTQHTAPPTATAR